MATTPGRAGLKAIIERCGLRLTEPQYDALWAYHRLLREADAELNLTRIRNFENMVLKHYVDSLLVLRYAELPSPLIDMGSGPGLPGIPLKIARPNVHVILAEPRGARAAFLRTRLRAARRWRGPRSTPARSGPGTTGRSRASSPGPLRRSPRPWSGSPSACGPAAGCS